MREDLAEASLSRTRHTPLDGLYTHIPSGYSLTPGKGSTLHLPKSIQVANGTSHAGRVTCINLAGHLGWYSRLSIDRFLCLQTSSIP